jgi:hypothetical protein
MKLGISWGNFIGRMDLPMNGMTDIKPGIKPGIDSENFIGRMDLPSYDRIGSVNSI